MCLAAGMVLTECRSTCARAALLQGPDDRVRPRCLRTTPKPVPGGCHVASSRKGCFETVNEQASPSTIRPARLSAADLTISERTCWTSRSLYVARHHVAGFLNDSSVGSRCNSQPRLRSVSRVNQLSNVQSSNLLCPMKSRSDQLLL